MSHYQYARPKSWVDQTAAAIPPLSLLASRACRRPPRYVPYKGTYVPYDGTYGAPDQGQMLDV
jgi:hypothetical protein